MSDEEKKETPVKGRMEVDGAEKEEDIARNPEPATEVGESSNTNLGAHKSDDTYTDEDDKGLFEDWDEYFDHDNDKQTDHDQRPETDVHALTLQEAARKEDELHHNQDDLDWLSEEGDRDDEEVRAITSTMTEGVVGEPRDLLTHGVGRSSSSSDDTDEEGREDNEYPNTNDVPDHDDRSNNHDDYDGDDFRNNDDMSNSYSPPPSKRPRLFF